MGKETIDKGPKFDKPSTQTNILSCTDLVGAWSSGYHIILSPHLPEFDYRSRRHMIYLINLS